MLFVDGLKVARLASAAAINRRFINDCQSVALFFDVMVYDDSKLKRLATIAFASYLDLELRSLPK